MAIPCASEPLSAGWLDALLQDCLADGDPLHGPPAPSASLPRAGEAGAGPTREEAAALLEPDSLPASLRRKLYTAARELRRRHFGDGVFLYGFLYASTWCRNDCRFCYYRRSNPHSARYRKPPAAIRAAAGKLAEVGVHLIDVTMGEDPQLHAPGGCEGLVELVGELKAATGLPLMVSPGLLPGEPLSALRRAGADWYALYQETHNRGLFAQLRPGQSYEERWQAKLEARRLGYLVEEGVLCGVGESAADLVDSLEAMRRLDADQVRAMSFVPQPGIPFQAPAAEGPGSAVERECLLIALMRLSFPDRLIPASLDVEGLDGLARRLEAGANVVTSIVPPGEGLAGVAQASLDIEEGRRGVGAVREVLARCGCGVARPEDYAAYLRRRQAARANDTVGARGLP